MPSLKSNARLRFMVGLPRSGKSTWAGIWQSEAPLEYDYDGSDRRIATGVAQPRVVVSGDSFRRALYGREFNLDCEGMVFATMDVAIKALLDGGHDVLVDETASTEETVLRYLRIDINAEPVIIDTPAVECMRRAREDGKNYLIPVIERIDRQMRELWSCPGATMARLRHRLRERNKTDSLV